MSRPGAWSFRTASIMVAPAPNGGSMRLVFGFVLAALVCVLSVALWGGGASALMPGAVPSVPPPVVHDAKIVCGDFGEGFTCKREEGAVRRSDKTPTIPGSSSQEASPPPVSGDSDALSPAPGDTGGYAAPPPAATPAPRAIPATCPAKTELLGGHCIPYTQRCTNGIPPSAYPPQCRSEEKQVCNFHPDGTKDCCCRVYSKY
jgi:hypothetical protein